ncbi:MAG: ABC transporter permease [Acidimicrobiia bacterium]
MTTIDLPGDPPPARHPLGEMYEVAPRRSVLGHIGDVWTYRELLKQLIRKELKVKYKNSSLGFAWSMLNPAFLMLVYWLVFSYFLESSQPNFPIWILSGLLVWNFFSQALVAGTNSITANSYLVGKVRFPREILPLASVGAGIVHFLLQTSVLLAAMLAFRYDTDWAALWLALPALLTAVVLVSALAMLLSAINVYARDTQHLLELLMLAWFWLTPILVPFETIAQKLGVHGIERGWIQLNPLVSVVTTMQRAFYGDVRNPDFGEPGQLEWFIPHESQWWYLQNLLGVLLVACGIMVLAIKVFDRAEGNFAEVL